MAMVPYRVSGAGADQRADERLLLLPGGVQLRLRQVAAPLPLSGGAAGRPSGTAAPAGAVGPPLERLADVGLVVWQAGWVLAEYLLRVAPFCGRGGGPGWRSVTAVDLGTGTGLVGIALAAAGARVVLTDLPHVLPLAAANLAANCDPRVTRAALCAYRWGDDPAAGCTAAGEPGCTAAGGTAAAAVSFSPLVGLELDLITAGDVLYHPELAAPLMRAVQVLSAPHTVTYVSYKVRAGGEAA
ncbi:Methyltransferase-like protein 21A, partial [Tetrabaena socialis]